MIRETGKLPLALWKHVKTGDTSLRAIQPGPRRRSVSKARFLAVNVALEAAYRNNREKSYFGHLRPAPRLLQSGGPEITSVPLSLLARRRNPWQQGRLSANETSRLIPSAPWQPSRNPRSAPKPFRNTLRDKSSAGHSQLSTLFPQLARAPAPRISTPEKQGALAETTPRSRRS